MGNVCSRTSTSDVEEVTSATLAVSDAPSLGYRSRANSLQTSPTANKYANESDEDRSLRIRVCAACFTGKVRNLQDLVAEYGQHCLDLRSTSLLDCAVIEPLEDRRQRYRKPRTSGGGAASQLTEFASGKEVLERSMGIRGDAGPAKRRSLTLPLQPQPPPTAAAAKVLSPSSVSPPAALVSFQRPPSPPILDETRLPHAVPPDPSASGASTIGASGVQMHFSPLRPPVSDDVGISMCEPSVLERRAADEAAPDTASNGSPCREPVALDALAGGQGISWITSSSPLICAASVGSRELVSFLLNNDQDINETVHRTTALIVAVRNAHSAELIKFMISRGAKAHVGRGQVDKQALHYACEVGDLSTVRVLLDEKAVVNWLSRDGTTAMHIAVRNGFTDLVKVLMSYGGDPSIKEMSTSMDCFEIANSYGFTDIAAFLKHCKRNHPTQFGVASTQKSSTGIINGVAESEMSKGAQHSVLARSRAVQEYMEVAEKQRGSSIEALVRDQTTRLNPSLARSANLMGVPANPAVQDVNVDRSKPRARNPNTIVASLAMSERNPPPVSDAAQRRDQVLADTTPQYHPMDALVSFADALRGDIHASADPEPSTSPSQDRQTPPPLPGTHESPRTAKALFAQKGWSERTHHTTMSRRPPERVLVDS